MRHEKISTGLLGVWLEWREGGAAALTSHSRSLGITNLGTQKEPRVIVFVRCDDAATFPELAEKGITVNEASGPLRTAYLPLRELDEFSEHPDVLRIAATHVAKPKLNIACPFVHVPEFRAENGVDGTGVIVGIVDTGIDPNHPNFAGRIMRIWDQTLTGPGVPEGAFGLELTGPTIVASRDADGHGTHVAGIAAGADSQFTGVAPKAGIVFVKTDFNTGHIANGIRYIFRIARELGRPAVINLSLGSHFDAHDGTDDLSEMIDQLSGPGRIVCCAAGNEAEDNIHARTRIAEGEIARLRFAVPGQVPPVVLNGWYGPTDILGVAIEAPDGQRTPFQGAVGKGSHARSFSLAAGRVMMMTPGVDHTNGDNHFEIQIAGSDSSSAPMAGLWKLLVHGTQTPSGMLDVWATDLEADSTIHFLDAVADDMKIGSPGAAASALTVGSFTTRTAWQDQMGRQHALHLNPDTISPFSSPGPLRNGGPKPDITAPGAVIASALSADSHPDPEFILSSTMRMDLGTSMATPFITGIVALLLQCQPELTPEMAKKLLKFGSRIPDTPPETFSPIWGFGLVDATLLLADNKKSGSRKTRWTPGSSIGVR